MNKNKTRLLKTPLLHATEVKLFSCSCTNIRNVALSLYLH